MRRVGGIALVAAALLAGCGSGFAEKAARPPVTVPGRVNNEGTRDVSATDRFELELRDFAFKPTFLKAAPGQLLKITLNNTSRDRHTFTLATLTGPDVVVPPHAKAHVEVSVPLSGTLLFSCRFHQSLGMQGAIYTRPGDPVIGAPGGVTSTTAPTPYPSGWGS